ncbi:MAG: type 4a pilus biogenesis protein PilO [Candidatus Shapirobacteria bacterium]
MIELNSFIQIQQIYKYVRKQRENQKFLKYIEIAATFILISVFLFLAIKPTATTIFSLLGDIKSKELQTKQMKAKIVSIVAAQDLYSQVEEKYDVIESSLPDKPKYYQSALNFSSLSQKSNTSLDQVNFNLSTDDNKKLSTNIDSYSVNIISQSNYNSALEFIKNILSNRRLVDLKTIQLSKPDDKISTSSGNLKLNITAKLFYLKDQNEKK